MTTNDDRIGVRHPSRPRWAPLAHGWTDPQPSRSAEALLSLASRLDLPTEVREPLEATKTEAENGLERLQEWSNVPT